MLAERLRNRIACYAAAITIILQQLNTIPISEPLRTPTPLVRIEPQFSDEFTWHPDELVPDRYGGQSVVVWDAGLDDHAESVPIQILSN